MVPAGEGGLKHLWGEEPRGAIPGLCCPTGETRPWWGVWGQGLRPAEGLRSLGTLWLLVGIRFMGRWAAGTGALGRVFLLALTPWVWLWHHQHLAG